MSLHQISTVFKLDGTEVEAWAGTDPTPQDSEKGGVSVIPIKINYKINRIKVYIDSKNVPYWNEIDAVGIRDAANKMHRAVAVDASSTYAQDVVPVVAATDPALLQRLTSLETEVKELKEQLQTRDKKLAAEVQELEEMLKQALKKNNDR